MTTAQEIFTKVMNKIKNLKEYQVTINVTKGWYPQGVVPFDMHISNGVAIITVLASSHEDAEQQVSKYMEQYEQN
jgi:hypothetical protein